MQPVPKTPTTALVLETNNLTGGRGDPDGVEHSLARLLGHLRAQTRPLASLDEVVVVHAGLAPAAQDRLRDVGGPAPGGARGFGVLAAHETWRPRPTDVRCDS